MKTKIPKPFQESAPNWQLLGELQLPLGAAADPPIQGWLGRTLGTLILNEGLVDRIIRSAREAVNRAAQSEHVRRDFKHLHLRVYSSDPTLVASDSRQTWGFFRIEKVGLSRPDGDPTDHSIEIYLYREDQRQQPQR